MRSFKSLLTTVLLLIMAAAGPAFAAPVKILALGSSLTQGYGLPPGTEFTVQLQTALKQAGIDAAVTNAGVSGDTSAGGLARLDWSLGDSPDAVILELGSNDMLRGIPPAVTEKNLRAILDRLKAAHVKVLLTGMHAQRNLGQDYVQQFDAIYPRLARDYNVLFYPFFLDGVALKPKLNQADGMHPNPAGVKVIVTRMLPMVKTLLSKEGKDR
ncbi:MAG TPA: arylesterase [Rhizomicrobium sp.]|nr:arylesterase [Rhizomicrobium sp.]